mgnify:CR=1 FL=1
MSGEEEIAEVEAEVEAEIEIEIPSPPPTPIPKPRAPRKKKDAVVAATAGPPVAIEANADFWGELLATRRAMDREAARVKYSNLVKF